MKKLIVFYSYTGNTKKIANKIKEKLDCDILEVEPQVPFSDDYDEVVNEYQNNSINKEVEIKDIKINLNDYDEFIIGTPVWWYTISPVIIEFLKKYKLENKTIYPFATNAGWLGHTFKDFEKLCTNNTIKEEMNIVFDTNDLNKLITKEEEINNWINKINED